MRSDGGCCSLILLGTITVFLFWIAFKFLFVSYTFGASCLIAIIGLAAIRYFALDDSYKAKNPDRYINRRIMVVLGIALLTLAPLGYYGYLWRRNIVAEKVKMYQLDLMLERYADDPVMQHKLDRVSVDVVVRNHTDSYNHVGHEWIRRNYIDGERIKAQKTISYHYGDSLLFNNEITEWDIDPDRGTSGGYCTFSKEELTKGAVVTFDTYVYEDRGKYAGCCCHWKTTYELAVDNPDKKDLSWIEASQDSIWKYFWHWGNIKVSNSNTSR